jgi:two-component system sensor histidine kinase AlgZ
MRDPGELVSLADEIELGKQYLELERLRLGDRLNVDWQIDDVALDLPIPPLMLQPLLENAVYHGIEPTPEGGTVRIAIGQRGDELRIVIANPTTGQIQNAAGNRMALANIRERLALYYDLEARLDSESLNHHHEVRISLPWRKKAR